MSKVYKDVSLNQLETIKKYAQKILAGRADYNISIEHYLREIITEQRNEALQIKNLINMILKQQ